MPLGAAGLAALAAAFSAFLALAGAFVGLALALLAGASILTLAFARTEATAVLTLAFASTTPLTAFAFLPVLVRVLIIVDVGVLIVPGFLVRLLQGQAAVARIL